MNEIKKTFLNDGKIKELYYYRDTEQNEIDLVLIDEGTISLIEIKSGQEFNVSDVQAFKKLEKVKLQKGKNAIICTCSKLSILKDGTYLIPVKSI